MVQRLFNIDKWTTLREGEYFSLAADRVRTIRLEVNAPQRVQLFAIGDNDLSIGFLATVEGRDTIEFVARGPISVSVEGGAVDVYSVDGEDISVEIVAPKIFTKIMERRRRNPELEAIVFQMNANMERRLAIQADDLRRLLTNRENARAALEAARGVPVGDASKPPPDDQPGTSDPSTAGALGVSDDDPERG